MSDDLGALQARLRQVRAQLAAVNAELLEQQQARPAANGMRPGALEFKDVPSLEFGRRVFRNSVPASPKPEGWTDDMEPPCA